MTVRRGIGPLRLHVEGLEDAVPPTRRWLESQLLDLPDARGDGPILHLRFVDELPAPAGGSLVDPLGYAPEGVVISDLAGRSARLPLPDPCVGTVLIDRRMNRYQVEEWVIMPLLRLALERAGMTLVRCSAVVLDGRAIAIAAPMRTGKTRLLLALLERGARPVGDDWIALDPEGSAHPVLTGLMLRDVHRDQLSGRWPGPSARGRRWLVQFTAWSARRTAARLPALSVGFDRLATTGWVLGFHSAPLSAIGAQVAGPAPLGTLVFLSPPSMPEVDAADVPGIVARLGDLDARPNDVIEAGFAALHPAKATDPLFLPADHGRRALESAVAVEQVTVLRVDDRPWVDEAVERILAKPPGVGRPGT